MGDDECLLIHIVHNLIELRNPLHVIVGTTELRQKHENCQCGCKEYEETIIQSSNMMMGIVDDVLDLTKIEKGKMQVGGLHDWDWS